VRRDLNSPGDPSSTFGPRQPARVGVGLRRRRTTWLSPARAWLGGGDDKWAPSVSHSGAGAGAGAGSGLAAKLGRKAMLGCGDGGQQLGDDRLLRGLERAAAFCCCWALKWELG
jgi:hypothetical protein